MLTIRMGPRRGFEPLTHWLTIVRRVLARAPNIQHMVRRVFHPYTAALRCGHLSPNVVHQPKRSGTRIRGMVMTGGDEIRHRRNARRSWALLGGRNIHLSAAYHFSRNTCIAIGTIVGGR